MNLIRFTIASLLCSAGLNAQCHVYDIPSVDQGNSTCFINDVVVDGLPYSATSGIQPSGNSYQSFPTNYIPMTQGQQYQVFVGGSNSVAFSECVWIDFNNDSIYTNAELVGYSANANNSFHTYMVNVPHDAAADTVHMRVMRLQASSGWGGGNDDACYSWMNGGEVEDYIVIISCSNMNYANFDSFQFLCYEDSVMLAANTQYGDITWYTDSSASPVYTGGNYMLHLNGYTQDTSLFIQNTTAGCFDGPMLEMVINFLPTPIVHIAGPDTVQSCSAITFDAGPGHLMYMWSNGGQSQYTTISSAYGGNLTVNVDDGNGCMGTDHVWVNIATGAPATYAHLTTDYYFCSNHGIYLSYDSLINPGTVNWYTYPANTPLGNGSWVNYTLPDTGNFQFTAIISSRCGPDTALVSIYAEGEATYDSLYSPAGTLVAGVYNVCPGTGLVHFVIAGLNGTVVQWEIGDTISGNWYSIYDDDTFSFPAALMQNGVTYAAYAIIANAQGCSDTTVMMYASVANSLAFNWPDTSFQCSFPVSYGVASVNYGVYDILWNTGDTTNQISITAPGYFTITTVDHSTGCTINDHVYIADGALPNNPLPDTTVACNGSAYFDINAAGYNAFDWWEYDETWQFINNNSSSDYTVFDNGLDAYLIVDAQNTHGCFVHDTTYVDFGGSFTFTLGPNVTTMVSPYTITAPAGYQTYYWTPGGFGTNTMVVSSTNTYTLTIDNGQGCTWTDVITITILPTAITNTTSDAAASVFPNPANDHITVQSSTTISHVKIYDLHGRLVHTQSCVSKSAEVNISELPDGCYIVEAITEEGTSRSRLVKQQ